MEAKDRMNFKHGRRKETKLAPSRGSNGGGSRFPKAARQRGSPMARRIAPGHTVRLLHEDGLRATGKHFGGVVERAVLEGGLQRAAAGARKGPVLDVLRVVAAHL